MCIVGGDTDMSTLVLCANDVLKLLDMKAAIGAIEQAFKDLELGRAQMPPKAYVTVDRGDFRAMPAMLPGAVGVKWVNVHPQNRSRNLPTVMGVFIYNDPETGYPLAIMDATHITAYRTGATAAIASMHLARRDSSTLGIIGAGRQAHTQIMAHAEAFDLRLIRVFDPFRDAVDRLIRSFPEYPIKRSSLEATAASDIVCTLTPARQPYLKREWLLPGTHINAIGADAEGKEELEPAILNEAMVVVDDLKQASGAGEINVPVSRGIFSVNQVYATLGEVIAGKKKGRTDRDAITVFDSTGVAIEDVAIARQIYEKAREGAGGFMSVDIVGVSER
jgi:alanine dehydrogenase